MSLSAAAADTVIGGRNLHLREIGNYCALDLESEVDALLFKIMVDLQRGTNELAAYWIDCEELASLHRGDSDRFSSYVLILAQLSGRKSVSPVDMPLDSYLAEIKRYLEQADRDKNLLPENPEAFLRERIYTALGDIGADGSGICIGETR